MGRVGITRIIESEGYDIPLTVLYPNLPSGTIERHKDWFVPQFLDTASGRLAFSIHSFVIRTPKHTILVDACSGNDKDRPQKKAFPHKSWPFLERLEAAGVLWRWLPPLRWLASRC